MDFARRPLSSNVFSVKSKEGEIEDSSVARDKPVMVELCLKPPVVASKRVSEPVLASEPTLKCPTTAVTVAQDFSHSDPGTCT